MKVRTNILLNYSVLHTIIGLCLLQSLEPFVMIHAAHVKQSSPVLQQYPYQNNINNSSEKHLGNIPNSDYNNEINIHPLQGDQPQNNRDLKALSGNISSILNSIREGYDKRVRPNFGGEAVEVGITMFVLSVSQVSEMNMDFTLNFYFRQMWNDPRLKFQGPKGVNTISVSSEFMRTLWVPDTFFVNEKTTYFHTATINNEFLRISQTGDVLRSMRITVRASCPMDLRHFPMDSQLCTLEMESFGYTMSDIRYKWAKGASSMGMSSDVSLPEFRVYGYRQKSFEISLSSGNYSRLACEIQFVRSMGYYLIQIYIPSCLIVVISWISFWINRNAATARVFLGVITLLTMFSLISSTNKTIPKISYFKAVDVYLGTCFVMVLAALLEYATVGYLDKHIQMRKKDFEALQNAREEEAVDPQKQQGKNEGKPVGWDKIRQFIPFISNTICGITPSGIEKFSRVIFPACFICFNFLYWYIYLHMSTLNATADLVLLNP